MAFFSDGTQLMAPNTSVARVQLERTVLGCLLESPVLWPDAELETADFLLENHRTIWQAIWRLNSDGESADLPSVAAAVDDEKVGTDYLASLIDGVVTSNFQSYVRQLRKAIKESQFQHLHEQLGTATTSEERTALIGAIVALDSERSQAGSWRALFHSVTDFENAAPLQFAINGFLQESGITLVGALPSNGKTLVMLSMTKALLEGSPLFGYAPFSVPHEAKRVLYLIPESSLGPFWTRIKLFRLEEFVRTDRLLVRTLSAPEELALDDARLLKAAEGSHIFLDTACRFMTGSENDVENARPFADLLFRLLASGARSICGAHHSPKGFEGQDFMTLQNILRGSGDLGAMLSTCWGIRQIDATKNRLYIANIKPRDFQPCEPFVIEGRPHLDATGQFRMLHAPGEAEELSAYVRSKNGRPVTADKDDKVARAIELRAAGLSLREIARNVSVSKTTVERWLFDFDSSQKVSHGGQGFGTTQNPDAEVTQ
jgi:hypothetical protein